MIPTNESTVCLRTTESVRVCLQATNEVLESNSASPQEDEITLSVKFAPVLTPVSASQTVNISSQVPPSSEWSNPIGPDPSRYCALIGWNHCVATPALLCHKDTAQGTQSPLLRAFLAFHCVFMA